ncbi:Dihydroorotase (EC [Olavius sp. associated proteobacterium Delta 1]|nr:Dihydroorotase (EC [Olavius sp. associated proteobacterium Delta 1]
MKSKNEVVVKRPDDWHLHLRDGEMLQAVLPFSAELYGRAIIMPNLRPPVRTVKDAAAYRRRILNCLPAGHGFQPLMTLYLTDETPPAEIRLAKSEGLLTGVKLYPVGATTNSEHGVTSIKKVYRVLEVMQELDMPLLIHGEVSDPAVDIFDRESVFIDRELQPLRQAMPELKIVMEHVSSKIGVDYVLAAEKNLGTTVTPHHLLINRNSIFAGGLNPHMYCLPVVKREADRLAIRQAAVSGDPRFFFGSDSAPHRLVDKEKAGGAAGVFNISTALSSIVRVFEAEESMDKLEAFMSLNGARFYGMPVNPDTITLQKTETPVPATDNIPVGRDRVKVFQPREPQFWQIVDGLRQTK